MAHPQLREAAGDSAVGDAERGELLWQGLMRCLQLFQRSDHVGSSRELRAPAVRAEFSLAREPKDDEAGEDAEHDLRHDNRYEKRRAAAVIRTEESTIDEVSNDARQEDHERVDHALDQRQGHHVPVCYVTDLVTKN